VVKLLLDYNADCSISGINGTPQEIAERVGDAEVLQALAEALGSKKTPNQLVTPAKRMLNTLTHTHTYNAEILMLLLLLLIFQLMQRPTGLQSLTFDPRVLELAEAQGYDTSVAIACLYQLQKRGAPTDNLELLIKEINKHSHHHQRECSICLCNEIDALLLPCRYVGCTATHSHCYDYDDDQDRCTY
jgi:hypothetical protein